MDRHGREKGGVASQAVKNSSSAAGGAGRQRTAKPDGANRLVDKHDGGGRDHSVPRSVYSQKINPEADAGTVISVAIHGMVILPKQGDRSTIRNGKIRHYTDKRVAGNAKLLAVLLGPHAPPEPWTGPVTVEVIAGFHLRKTESAIVREYGWDWDDTKPDPDNISKQVLDVLQRCGFFKNDSQVVRLVVTKLRMENPVTRIRIINLSDAPLEKNPPRFLLHW